MKKRSKIIITIVTVAAVIGAAAIWRSGGSKTAFETEPVGRGTVIQEVTVTGSLQPAERVSLEPEVSGKVTDIKVTEGNEVKSGDVLIQLDDRDLQSRLASQRAALAAARANLSELVAGPTSEDLALSQSSVAAAESRLEAAKQAQVDSKLALENSEKSLQATKDKTVIALDSKTQGFIDDMRQAMVKASDAMVRLDGPLYSSSGQLSFSANSYEAETKAVNTLRTAKQAVDDLKLVIPQIEADGTLDGVLARYSEVKSLMTTVKEHIDASAAVLNYAIGLSDTTVQSYQANINLAQTSLSSATDQLVADKAAVEVQKSLNESEITMAEISLTSAKTAVNTAASAVDTAEKAVLQALAEYDLKKSGARPQNIEAQRARVLVEEAALNGLLTDLTKRRITAPIDGVVTDVNVKRGETVSPGVPVVSLNAQGRFEIVSNISEVDISKIKVGQAVHITLDAFSRNEEWNGKVTKIFPAEKVVEGVIFYETKVVFDVDDERLKSGMTANLSIETARKDDVLRIPLRALKESKGKDYVDLLVDGAAKEVEIKLGVENSVYAELVEGAKEGDLVIVSKNN